jgi:hypothetical protein
MRKIYAEAQQSSDNPIGQSAPKSQAVRARHYELPELSGVFSKDIKTENASIEPGTQDLIAAVRLCTFACLRSSLVIIKEFVRIRKTRVHQKPGGELFQARPISLCLVGHHPLLSKLGASSGPGLNCFFTLACPRSPRVAPRSWACLLTDELLSNQGASLCRRHESDRQRELEALPLQTSGCVGRSPGSALRELANPVPLFRDSRAWRGISFSA